MRLVDLRIPAIQGGCGGGGIILLIWTMIRVPFSNFSIFFFVFLNFDSPFPP